MNAGGAGWKYGVALEQADGADHLYNGNNRGDAGDPFPGSTTNRTFDSTATNPNSRTNYPLTNPLMTGCLAKNIPNPALVMSCTLSSGVVGSFTGGPDAYGYKWIDSDTTGGPLYSWIDISATGTPLGTGDDVRYSFALPFNFNFYGNNYNQVWVCTNGWLSFGNDPMTNAWNNMSIPDTTAPNNAVFVFWDDLILLPGDNANIYYQIFGSEPNRYCVITWKDARIKGVPFGWLRPPNQVTFQIILYEGGKIVLQYKDCAVGDTTYNWGKSATVGIENATGTAGLQYLYNGSPSGNLLANERAIQFTSIVGGIDASSNVQLLPKFFNLEDNTPNPFVSYTLLQYALPKDCGINLRIYNSSGIVVRTLKAGIEKAGVHRVAWNGDDKQGKKVPKGVYFYRLEAGEFKETKKMVKME